jgi:uncharacterized membrane protein
MILAALSWWLVSSLLGWAAFPLSARLLWRLPDRGLGVSRALALLAAGYLLWIGASFHVVRNSVGGAIAVSLIVAGAGVWAGWRSWDELRSWLHDRWRSIVAMELVFLVAYAVWAFVRANNPDITATEKPMELAFLNSILRTDFYPAADPWLSGYAISYYHFGYVLLAYMTRLTGVSAGVAFNLGNALWFALTAVGSFSVVYNLVNAGQRRIRLAPAFLGPILLLISGNLEAVLDVLWARRAFWRPWADGVLQSGFWQWLNIQELTRVPSQPPTWLPYRDGGFWWWRASRVIHDVNLAGQSVEVIDEFPFFSFLLADNHPHLLALPFVLLALSLALHVFLAGRRTSTRLGNEPVSRTQIQRGAMAIGIAVLILVSAKVGLGITQGLPTGEIAGRAVRSGILAAGGATLLGVLVLFLLGSLPSLLERREFWFAAWVFGALAFLNTWDFPIYLSVLVGVMLWTSRQEAAGHLLRSLLWTGLGLGVGGVLLYLPWYPTFSSQASGILPNLLYPTRLPHFLVMFGTMLGPLLVWLVWRGRAAWSRGELRRLVGIGLGVPLGLLALSWLLAGAALLIQYRDPGALGVVLDHLGVADIQSGIGQAWVRRLTTSWTALILGFMLGAAVVLLLRRGKPSETDDGLAPDTAPFVLVMIAIGSLLVLVPEFVYLRDLFGDRMNTVFKFYFAAWNLWSLAAAALLGDLARQPQRWVRAAGAALLVPICLGLVYPVLATWTKTDGFNPYGGRRLDGIAYMADSIPEDAAAIAWIQGNLQTGVISEAVGGSYSGFGRISAHTGLPTVLGWPFHEVQWRGSADLLGSREQDIQRLYTTRDWLEAQTIVEAYGIDYVYVGPMEQLTYSPLVTRKFEAFMDIVYQADGVTIFARRGERFVE